MLTDGAPEAEPEAALSVHQVLVLLGFPEDGLLGWGRVSSTRCLPPWTPKSPDFALLSGVHGGANGALEVLRERP